MASQPSTIEVGTSDHGYANRDYAYALEEFGVPRELTASGGWLLARPVPGGNAQDGMGCYPLFSCLRWDALGEDLDALADDLVCVALVTDPFADTTPELLREQFPDVCYRYKEHFVVDLGRPLEDVVQSHHRRNVRKSLARFDVRRSSQPDELLAPWVSLYDQLVQRHAITGIARFSTSSFQRQVNVPGFVAFAAYRGDAICGMTLWCVRDDVAYYHLGAYNDEGYAHGASFAIFWTALSHFATAGVRWAALGAGAGTLAADSGLTRFKQGWATESRPVYFCGRVLQPSAYRRLSGDDAMGGFFPAYRRQS